MIENNKKILIKADSLSLAYDGVTVASGVSFTLEEGGYLCVIGENGSGKSTLLKAVTGEIKPSGGTLTLSDELKKSGIGYLPQQSSLRRDFPATVREVILSGCLRHERLGLGYSDEAKEKAKYAAQSLGLIELMNRRFGELSGGQRQRVCLARAMCASDKLLVLDEPVTGLDPAAAHDMYSSIRRVNETGCAVMTVTHDVVCALREAGTVLSMCRGHSYFGDVAGYMAHEKHDEEDDVHYHRHSGNEEKEKLK